eukprot:1977997-Rhodomonas_salina.1
MRQLQKPAPEGAAEEEETDRSRGGLGQRRQAVRADGGERATFSAAVDAGPPAARGLRQLVLHGAVRALHVVLRHTKIARLHSRSCWPPFGIARLHLLVAAALASAMRTPKRPVIARHHGPVPVRLVKIL